MHLTTQSLFEEAMQRNRELLLQALREHGITEAFVTYSGGGDSGDQPDADSSPAGSIQKLREAKITQFEVKVNFEPEGGKTQQLVEVTKSVRDALCDFAMDWIDSEQSAWYDGDGGSGRMDVDVTEGKFSLEHFEYYVESNRHEYTL